MRAPETSQEWINLYDESTSQPEPTKERRTSSGNQQQPKRKKRGRQKTREVTEEGVRASGRELVLTGSGHPEHQVNDQVVKGLSKHDGLFQRGGTLVAVRQDLSPATSEYRQALAPRIVAVPKASVREMITKVVVFAELKVVGENMKLKEVPPPRWCYEAVHARGEWPGIRHLECVVDHPVICRDGRLLASQGYDRKTALLVLPGEGLNVNVSSSPTHDDALEARDTLLDVVCDFPFADQMHRSAWLAGLLTPLARFAFAGPSPLFLIDANIRGSGKGKLVDVIHEVVTGSPARVTTWTADENEFRKRLTSLLIAGDRMAVLDNLAGPFGSGTLDAMLTASSWKDRVLGLSKNVEVPVLTTWYATGNNVNVVADTVRRVAHIRLDSPLENPEQRSDFRHPNLLEYVRKHRSELLSAALTILRAFFGAGCPDHKLLAWGSFEGWSRVIRNAIVWCDMPDPGETREEIQSRGDEEAQMMRGLLDCWNLMDQENQGLTASDVLQRLYRIHPSEFDPEYYVDMRQLIETLCIGKPTSRKLGAKLSSYKRRNFGGLMIDESGTLHRAVKWRVVEAQ
ncbi:MAG: hypothetical protein ACFCD0_11290 [Gemmataceae bacterium]